MDDAGDSDLDSKNFKAEPGQLPSPPPTSTKKRKTAQGAQLIPPSPCDTIDLTEDNDSGTAEIMDERDPRKLFQACTAYFDTSSNALLHGFALPLPLSVKQEQADKE